MNWLIVVKICRRIAFSHLPLQLRSEENISFSIGTLGGQIAQIVMYTK